MIWSFGRAVVYLKQMVALLDRMAEAQERMARLDQQRYSWDHPMPTREAKKAEFGVADVAEDWNKKWEIEHPEAAD